MLYSVYCVLYSIKNIWAHKITAHRSLTTSSVTKNVLKCLSDVYNSCITNTNPKPCF